MPNGAVAPKALAERTGWQNRTSGAEEEFPMQLCRSFIDDGSGATAIEYGLIAGFLSIVIVVGVTIIGTSLESTFASVASALTP
jgi:pilus assembly protein Flp/PilA